MTDAPGRTGDLHAYFSYRDAPAALDWLERALGFTVLVRVPDERGGIMHSELRRGDVSIMVFSDDAGYDRPALKGESVGHGTYLSVEDAAAVEAVFASATEAGATVVWPPAPTEWGSHRCRLLDPEGFEWTFGTLRPGEAAGDWS